MEQIEKIYKSLKATQEKLSDLYKEPAADPKEIRFLEEEVDFLSDILQSLSKDAYDKAVPGFKTETASIASLDDFINNL